jgi:predicted DNA-binding ArsR family transcriptional regulator
VKVIGFSNYGLDNVSDILVADNLPRDQAEALVNRLNDEVQEGDTYFYGVRPDDYKLYKWEP